MDKSIKHLKKNNKLSKSSRKSKLSTSKKNMQKGGVVSSACVLPYTNDIMSYRGQSAGASADIHNTNPQASLDLDNKFMSYGGPVPLGQAGGSNKCGDEGVGTSNPKSATFKSYLNNLDKQLSFNGGSNCGIKNSQKGAGSLNGGSNCGIKNSQKGAGSLNGGSNCGIKNSQKGAGYTLDPLANIAGNPQVIGYPDNNPPAIIGGKLVMGGVEGSLCGNGAVAGGGKKSKLQKGGDFVSIGSKPAEFSTAFDGPKGVFKYPDDMMAREFGERQPNYSVNAI